MSKTGNGVGVDLMSGRAEEVDGTSSEAEKPLVNVNIGVLGHVDR